MSGLIVFAFIVYHLLHFTTGTAMAWQGVTFATPGRRAPSRPV